MNISQHQWIFVSDTLHMQYYNPPMKPYNLQQTVLPPGGYHCVSDVLVMFIPYYSGMGRAHFRKNQIQNGRIRPFTNWNLQYIQYNVLYTSIIILGLS